MAGSDASTLRISPCGPERAEDVHRLTQLAFAPYSELDPPSSACRETLADLVRDLTIGGGAIAVRGGLAIGCLRWELEADGGLYARRVAVDPAVQGAGVGLALMEWVEAEAARRSCPSISVGVRVALPRNRRFFERLGFQVAEEGRHDGYDFTTWLKLRKRLV